MFGVMLQLIFLFFDIVFVYDVYFFGLNGFLVIGQIFKRFLIDDKRGNGRLFDIRIYYCVFG